MAKPPRLYTRLTRPTSSVGSYNSLWLAADHLLVVNSTGYNESYRRFLLRDIQGFWITATDRRQSWGLGWGFFLVCFGIVMITSLSTGGTPVFSSIGFGVSLVFLIWNHLLGPGCHVHVVTGVQTFRLPSLVRRRKAMKVLLRLEPLILAAQADLTASASPSTVAADNPPEPPPLPPL